MKRRDLLKTTLALPWLGCNASRAPRSRVRPGDPNEFLRVHRSHVVKIGFIAELCPMLHGDYELVLRDGQRLGLSRRDKQLLPAAIRERL
jgi:hypothetical protein